MPLFTTIKNILEEEFQNLCFFHFVCFVSGIIFYYALPFEPTILYSSLILMSLCILLCIALKFINNITVHFILFSLIAALLGFSIAKINMFTKEREVITSSVITELSGIVESMKPTSHGMQITLGKVKILPDTHNQYNNIKTVKINISKKFIKSGEDMLNINDRISLKAKLLPLQNSVLPGTFNFGFYMYISGIQANGYTLTPYIIIQKSPPNYMRDFIDDIRFKLYAIVTNNMDINTGNILAAILLGYTKSIPDKVLSDIRNSGIAHILCVSGLHISLVAMIFFVISRILLNCSNFIAYNFNVKTIAASISLISSFIYLLLSGTNIAAIRAFIMTSIFIIALIIGKNPHPMRSLMVAAFVMLLISPSYVFHPSFQLSFIAVLCLISGYDFYQKYQHLVGERGGIFASIKFYIFANLYTTFIASFATAPFVIYHFYTIPTYTLIMNLIAVPLISFCIIPVGIISLILITVNLHHYGLNILSFFINIIIDSADYVASLPGSTIHIGHIAPYSLIMFSLGFTWLCILQTKIRYFGWILIIISGISMFFTPKPDFIYDFENQIIGIKNQDNKLEIYQHLNDNIKNGRDNFQFKDNSFLIKYWISWYGQKEDFTKKIKINKTDHLFITPNKQSIALSYNHCFPNTDVEITTSKRLSCNGENTLSITHNFLEKNKIGLIYCNDFWSKWIRKQCVSVQARGLK